MSLIDDLEKIQQANDADVESISEFDPQETGPSNFDIENILAVDMRTKVQTTPLVKKFYSFARYWQHSSIELIWLDPYIAGEIYRMEMVAQMINNDFGVGGALEGFDTDRAHCVLFAVDDLSAPYQRAYFLSNAQDDELKVVDAGSEITKYQNIAEYIAYWKLVIES